jgi:hypothetical protein
VAVERASYAHGRLGSELAADHRRAHLFVAEQFLDRTDVVAILEKAVS